MKVYRTSTQSLSGTLSGSENGELSRSERLTGDGTAKSVRPVHSPDPADSRVCGDEGKVPVRLITIPLPASLRAYAGQPFGTSDNSTHCQASEGSGVALQRHTTPLPTDETNRGEASLVSAKHTSARVPETTLPAGVDIHVRDLCVTKEPPCITLTDTQANTSVIGVTPKTPPSQGWCSAVSTPLVAEHAPFPRHLAAPLVRHAASPTSSGSTTTDTMDSPSTSDSGALAETHPRARSFPHSAEAVSEQDSGQCPSPPSAAPVPATRSAVPPSSQSNARPSTVATSTRASVFQTLVQREPHWWGDLWKPQVGSQVYLSLEGCEQQFFYLENLGIEVYHLIYDVLIPYRHVGLVMRDTAELPRGPRPQRRRTRQPAVHAGPGVPRSAFASEPQDDEKDDETVSPFADIVTADFKLASSKDVLTVEFVVADVLLDSVFGSAKRRATKAGAAPHTAVANSANPTVLTTSFTLTLPRVCFVVMFEQHLKETAVTNAGSPVLLLPTARAVPKRDSMEDSNERATGRPSSVSQSHSLWVRLQRGVTQGQFESVIQLLAPLKPLKEARHLFPSRKACQQASETSSPPAAVPPQGTRGHHNRHSQTDGEPHGGVADPLVHVMTAWTQLSYLSSVYIVLCALYFAAADDPRSLTAARRGFERIVEKARAWRHVVDRALGRDDFVTLNPVTRRFFCKAAYHLRANLDVCAIEAHLALGDWPAAQTLIDDLCLCPTIRATARLSTTTPVPTPPTAGEPPICGPLRCPLSQRFYLTARHVRVQRLLAPALCGPMFRGLPKTPSSLRQQCTSQSSGRTLTRTKDTQQGTASVLALVGSALVAPSPGVCRFLNVVDPGTYPAVSAGSPHALGPSCTARSGAGAGGAGAVGTSSSPLPPASIVATQKWSPSSLHHVSAAPDMPVHSSASTPLDTPVTASPSTIRGHSTAHTPYTFHVVKEGTSRLSIPSPPPLPLQTTRSSSSGGVHTNLHDGSAGLTQVPLADALARGKGGVTVTTAAAATATATATATGTATAEVNGLRASLLSLTLSERSRTASPDNCSSDTEDAAEEQAEAAGESVTASGTTEVSAGIQATIPSRIRTCRKSSRKSSFSTAAMLMPPPPPPSSTFIDRVMGIVGADTSSATRFGVEPHVSRDSSPTEAFARQHSRLAAETDPDTSNGRSFPSRSQLLGASAGLGPAALRWPTGAKLPQITQWLTLYARQRGWLQSGLFTQRAGSPVAAPMSLFQRQLRVFAPRSFREGDDVVSDEVVLWMPLLAPELRARHTTENATETAPLPSSYSSHCSTCGEHVDSEAHKRGRGAHGADAATAYYACASCGAAYGCKSCLQAAVTSYQFVVCEACVAALAEDPSHAVLETCSARHHVTHVPAVQPGTEGSATLADRAGSQLSALRAAFRTFQGALEKMSAEPEESTLLNWIALRLFGRTLAMLLTFLLCPTLPHHASIAERAAYLERVYERCGLHDGLRRTGSEDHLSLSARDPPQRPVSAAAGGRVLSSCDELLLAEALVQHVGVPFIADLTLAAPSTVWESLHALPLTTTPPLAATASRPSAEPASPPFKPSTASCTEERENPSHTQAPDASTTSAAVLTDAVATPEELVYALCNALDKAIRLPTAQPSTVGSAPAAGVRSQIPLHHLLSFITNLRFMDELFDLCRSGFALVPSTTVPSASASPTPPTQPTATVIVLSPVVSVVTDLPRLPLCSSGRRPNGTMTTLQQVKNFYAPSAAGTAEGLVEGVVPVSMPLSPGGDVLLAPVKPGWLNHSRFYLEHASWRLTVETEREADSPLAASSFLSIASSALSASASMSSHHHVPVLSRQLWSSDEDSITNGARVSEPNAVGCLHNVAAVLEMSALTGITGPRTGRIVLTATSFIPTGSALSLHGCAHL